MDGGGVGSIRSVAGLARAETKYMRRRRLATGMLQTTTALQGLEALGSPPALLLGLLALAAVVLVGRIVLNVAWKLVVVAVVVVGVLWLLGLVGLSPGFF